MSNPVTSAISEVELAGVNVLAGLKNIFGSTATSMESAAKTATSNASEVTSVLGGMVGSVGDVSSAISEIKELISDVEAGKWSEAPEDVIVLLKTFMAILTKFGVNVPVLTQIVAVLPNLPAIGKAA